VRRKIAFPEFIVLKQNDEIMLHANHDPTEIIAGIGRFQ
jgi:hypothetical protein